MTTVCLTKKDLILNPQESSSALNSRIQRQSKTGGLLKLKNGLYTTHAAYFNEPDKTGLTEFLSSQIYFPCYLSLEYALNKHHLLFHTGKITSITTKNTQTFSTPLGIFKYQNIKQTCYFGFEENTFKEHKYFMATKAKALFDYLYLKPNLQHRNAKKLKKQLFEELGIQWINFSEEDFQAFDKCVWKSNSHKMMRVLQVLNEHYSSKKFDKWVKELLK